jgi:hypothetical protein
MNAIIDNGLPEIPKPSADTMLLWDEWVASRPDAVRKVAEGMPPWFYYDYQETGQIVTIEAYAEDGTLRVTVVGDRISIPTIIPFEVFGVKPEDLAKREST